MAQYLTISEIAALLKRPAKKVRDVVVHQPTFPRVAIASGPRSRLWLADEVTAWAAQQAGQRSPVQTRGSTHAAADSRHDAR